MIVYVEGSTKVKRDHILESSFFYEKMLYKRRLPSLKIDIELEKDLEKTEKILGDCLWEDRRKKPRYFTIRIDGGVTLPRMLRALAHELVHVKQYSTGEMVDCRVDLDKVYWLDEEWKPSKHDYFDLPWEIEALGRESGLYYRYLEEYGYSGQKWVLNS